MCFFFLLSCFTLSFLCFTGTSIVLPPSCPAAPASPLSVSSPSPLSLPSSLPPGALPLRSAPPWLPQTLNSASKTWREHKPCSKPGNSLGSELGDLWLLLLVSLFSGSPAAAACCPVSEACCSVT